MAYLNLDLNFAEHPKFEKLETILGPYSSILVIRLWAYAGKYAAQDGILDVSPELIEEKIKWRGKKGAAIKALVESKFLVVENGKYVLHDWLDHQGHIYWMSKQNAQNAKMRWDKIRLKTGAYAPASCAPGKERNGAVVRKLVEKC